jgi:hypothetical protein
MSARGQQRSAAPSPAGHFDRAAHERVNALQSEIEATGVLVVHLLRGSQLLARDAGGTSDPYVKISLGEQNVKSSVVPNTLNPVWDERHVTRANPCRLQMS